MVSITVAQTPKIGKKTRHTEILRNLGFWGTKNDTFGQYLNCTYLPHHSIFQNGLIHIFITNIILAMKQNVKCIVLWTRLAKSTKSQVSDIEVFNKISIKTHPWAILRPSLEFIREILIIL